MEEEATWRGAAGARPDAAACSGRRRSIGDDVGRGGQDWPDRPVTLVVPYEPGGHTDIMARMLAEHITRSFGKAFVVENRSGAGGAIATTYVARAEPDGYTLLFGIGGADFHRAAGAEGARSMPSATSFRSA